MQWKIHIKIYIYKGNNKITEFRTILQRESQNHREYYALYLRPIFPSEIGDRSCIWLSFLFVAPKHFTRRVSGIKFIRYAQYRNFGKQNNLKVFGSNKQKG
jgi:hypothetical protein